MFASSERFRAAVQLMNGVEARRFGPLLARVLAKLHLPDEPPFAPAEEAALLQVLALPPPDLRALLDSVALVFLQAAYFQLPPDRLAAELALVGLEDAPALAFRTVWERGAEDVVRRLQELTLCPALLDGSGWRLHLQVAALGDPARRHPLAYLHMGLRGRDAAHAVETVQLDHAQLAALYADLERVQEQLDGLQ